MLKASLPSSLDGLNTRSAPLHAPAAYVNSLVQSTLLIARILEIVPDSFQHLASSVCALAEAAERPDWGSLEDISLSHTPTIDEASFHHLLDSAPDSRARALAFPLPFPMRVTGWMLSSAQPLNSISMIRNIGSAWTIGWVTGCQRRAPFAPSPKNQQTLLETTIRM